jgi:hypothetical protein
MLLTLSPREHAELEKAARAEALPLATYARSVLVKHLRER